MLKNSKGYFLAELLLSLTALFMISLFFLPLFADLIRQAQQLETERQADQIIYDELKAFLINEQPLTDRSLLLNGVEYQISWRNTGAAGLQEVCVKVGKHRILSETTRCRYAE